MAVKKKVIRSIDSFIDKGADVKSGKGKHFKNVLIRVPIDILNKVDDAISKKPWFTRTQWVVSAIHEKLNSEADEQKEGSGARN
jgi:hypothetical protein